MYMHQKLSLEAWWAITTPLGGIAIILTSFRLYHRYKIWKLWWDDLFALLSMLCEAIYLATPFLRRSPRHPSNLQQQILYFWLSQTMFPLVVWTARISIGMSIARLAAPRSRIRMCLYAINAGFGLIAFGFMFQRVYVCTRNTKWHSNPAIMCYLGNGIGYITLATDVVADACLVIIPINLFMRMKLPRKQRIMLLSIFASSALSTLVGIVYVVFVFMSRKRRLTWGYVIQTMAGIKAAVVLMVCNLLVVVTYIYRKFRHEEEDNTVSSHPGTTKDQLGVITFPTRPLPTTTEVQLTILETADMTAQNFTFAEALSRMNVHPTVASNDTPHSSPRHTA